MFCYAEIILNKHMLVPVVGTRGGYQLTPPEALVTPSEWGNFSLNRFLGVTHTSPRSFNNIDIIVVVAVVLFVALCPADFCLSEISSFAAR